MIGFQHESRRYSTELLFINKKFNSFYGSLALHFYSLKKFLFTFPKIQEAYNTGISLKLQALLICDSQILRITLLTSLCLQSLCKLFFFGKGKQREPTYISAGSLQEVTMAITLVLGQVNLSLIHTFSHVNKYPHTQTTF